MKHKKLVFISLIVLIISLGNCGCLKEEMSPLVACFSYSPENPTTNDVIQFHDESDHSNGSITSWHWDFDVTDEYSSETSTLQHPTYRYMWGYGSTFKVRLTVTDSQGNTDSVTKKVKIVGQAYLPKENDITLEILSHERKTHNLDGSVLPQYGFTCVWMELKMENKWDRDIYPTVGWDGIVSWGGNFYIYVSNHTKQHWGHSGIYPENTPEKLNPGDSAVWTVTFWIPEAAEEYKIKYAYQYDISYEWLRYRDIWPQQISIWAFL